MARKSFKAKEPVKIRTKKIADGNESIYLDYQSGGKRYREFLKLYYIPERTPADREKNLHTKKAAEAIMAQRISDLVNDKAGIKRINANILLTDWLRQRKQDYGRQGCTTEAQMDRLIDAVTAYKGEKIRLSDIDKEYCRGFYTFLTHERKNKITGKPLAAVTAHNYTAILIAAINAAKRAEIIPNNPFDLLERNDKIKVPESARVYLTAEEVEKLTAAKCPNEQVKQAFLFSCYCGLRLSDILALTWGHIINDGGQIQANMTMKKTKRVVAVPISKKAQEYLPKRGNTPVDVPIFTLPKGALNYDVKEWARRAGIDKNVTFHTARHTFATLLLTKDVNLAVVQDLLGHTNIRTTQIYAKVINKKKVDAVNLLNNIF